MSPRQKIAVICETANTVRQGGEQHAMLGLAKGLSTDYQVDVYSYKPTTHQKLIRSRLPLSLRLAPFIRDLIALPIIGRKLLRQLDSQYNIIYTSSTTIAACYQPQHKFITVCHIIRSQKIGVFRRIGKYPLLFNAITYNLMRYLEQRSLRRAHQIVVIREHQRQFLIETLKLNPANITVIPNGIDTTIFRPLQDVVKKNQIIFVGRTTFAKGFDLLLAAADHIKCDILVITQKGDPHLIRQAGTKTNMRLILNATPQELAQFYAQSRAFILPSLDEEQPLTVLEAMACDLPVIVSQKAAADIVQDHIHGIVLKSLTPHAIAQAVNNLMADNPTTIGKTNRKTAEQQYSQESSKNRYQQLHG